MTAPYRFGLIGFPLGHSLSPVLHETALQEFEMKGIYPLHVVAPFPEGRQKLEDLISAIRRGEINGLNVTIPHKQTVIPYLDGLSDAAQSIGAANTLVMEDGRLTGRNTDSEGFRRDLRRKFVLEPARALILGAGGSARAVLYALLREGWDIAVAARRRVQAEALATLAGPEGLQVLSFPLQRAEVERWQPTLIVNTTPLGMTPNEKDSPWPQGLPFPKGSQVYDLVYNPAETTLLAQARQSGAAAANGLGMLIEQAALSFEIWTGRSPSREKMHTALQDYLAMRK